MEAPLNQRLTPNELLAHGQQLHIMAELALQKAGSIGALGADHAQMLQRKVSL